MGEIEQKPTPGSRLGAPENSGISTLEHGQKPPPTPSGKLISIKIQMLDDTQEAFEVPVSWGASELKRVSSLQHGEVPLMFQWHEVSGRGCVYSASPPPPTLSSDPFWFWAVWSLDLCVNCLYNDISGHITWIVLTFPDTNIYVYAYAYVLYLFELERVVVLWLDLSLICLSQALSLCLCLCACHCSKVRKIPRGLSKPCTSVLIQKRRWRPCSWVGSGMQRNPGPHPQCGSSGMEEPAVSGAELRSVWELGGGEEPPAFVSSTVFLRAPASLPPALPHPSPASSRNRTPAGGEGPTSHVLMEAFLFPGWRARCVWPALQDSDRTFLENHYPLCGSESREFLAHFGFRFPCSLLGTKHHL